MARLPSPSRRSTGPAVQEKKAGSRATSGQSGTWDSPRAGSPSPACPLSASAAAPGSLRWSGPRQRRPSVARRGRLVRVSSAPS